MNYHVNRHGQNLGVFPIAEVMRRRTAGMFNGTEMVWRDGMAQWEAIDPVLQRDAPGSLSPNVPPAMQGKSRSKSTRLVLWIVGVCAFLFVGGLLLFGIMAARFLKEARSTILEEMTGDDPVSVASQPLVWATNTLTEADVQKQRVAFRSRQWIDGYKQSGPHSQPWDADAARLMQVWVDESDGGDDLEERAATRALAEKLIAAGCDDAMVLTIAGVRCIELNESSERLERAVAAYEKSKYKSYPRLYATAVLANKSTQRSRIIALDAAAVKLFERAFKDGSLRPDDQEQMARYLTYGWGEKFFERNRTNVCQILKDAGKEYEWLSLVMDGEFHIFEAWKARGKGYADTVSTPGWSAFSDHLDKARMSLTNAWNLRPDLASAPRRMITVCLGSSDAAEMREWFDRVIELQVDHPKAWADMQWGLRPRWHGSHEAMLALGTTAVDSERFDTDVPHKLFDIVYDVESELELPVGEHIFGRRDVWPDLEQMYEGYIAESSQASKQNDWRTGFAAAAFIAGKYETAREQLEALNWKPVESNLKNWCVNLTAMPLEVAARTGPCARLVADAEQNRNIGDLASALKIYGKVIGMTNADERTLKFARVQLALIEQEQRLGKGEWVSLLPSASNDANWTVTWGKPTRVSTNTLELECDPRGHLAYSRLRTGRDFEVRGEFDVVKSSNGDFQAGIVMGMPDCDSRFKSQAWYAFRMKRNKREGDMASYSKAWTQTQVHKPIKLATERNTFTFRLQDGKASATVNGEEIFSGVAPPQDFDFKDENFALGLGAFNDSNTTTLRYRNVQVRQISSAGGSANSK